MVENILISNFLYIINKINDIINLIGSNKNYYYLIYYFVIFLINFNSKNFMMIIP